MITLCGCAIMYMEVSKTMPIRTNFNLIASEKNTEVVLHPKPKLELVPQKNQIPPKLISYIIFPQNELLLNFQIQPFVE